MIDVLMIALQFAPVQSTGAYRSIEFAKRLQSYGVNPTVLTIDPLQASNIFGTNINPLLLQGLPEALEIRYLHERQPAKQETPARQLLRMICSLNDTFERRFAKALQNALRDLQDSGRKFAAVYASAPPFGATMLGAKAAKTLGVPYLLDMRDAWAQWSPAPRVTWLHHAYTHYDESRAFAAATAITTVTDELADLFAASHPTLTRGRFHTITNGNGHIEDLPDVARWDVTGETIDIGYVGSFYWQPAKPASLRSPHRYIHYDPGREDWSYRSPQKFFSAWAELDRLDSEAGSKFRFHHVGETPRWLLPMARELGLDERCIFHGPMPRQKIPVFLEKMTGLLATSMKRIGGKDYCLATKTFEYLASGKATLAFVCDGAQKRFFEEAGGAVLFDPDDCVRSAKQLQTLVSQNCQLSIRKEALKAYDLNNTTAQLAALLKQIAFDATLERTMGAT